eukprot:13202148-Heterocapsa_arctica.AAC.1
MELMLQFRSRMYICTATAEHWKIEGQDGVNYDKEAANVRDWARQKGDRFLDGPRTLSTTASPATHATPRGSGIGFSSGSSSTASATWPVRERSTASTFSATIWRWAVAVPRSRRP